MVISRGCRSRKATSCLWKCDRLAPLAAYWSLPYIGHTTECAPAAPPTPTPFGPYSRPHTTRLAPRPALCQLGAYAWINHGNWTEPQPARPPEWVDPDYFINYIHTHGRALASVLLLFLRLLQLRPRLRHKHAHLETGNVYRPVNLDAAKCLVIYKFK